MGLFSGKKSDPPARQRVRYGPGQDGYVWECARCARRPDGDGLGAGWTRSLTEARARAKRHARKHLGMRAVYEED